VILVLGFACARAPASTAVPASRGIIFHDAAVAALKSHLRASSFREQVGFGLGMIEAKIARVQRIVPALNSAVSPIHFVIDQKESARISRYAAGLSLRVILVYHTHPSGTPSLSPCDLEAIRTSPCNWVIATHCGSPAAYRLNGFEACTGKPLMVRPSKFLMN